MARIRTVKPEFWADEKLAPLSAIHRLVFLGLISMADDAGRLVDNVKAIDGFIFPESEESSRESLDMLARLGRIDRYVSESGQRIIQIANWKRHQKVDKPSKHCLPAPSTVSRNTRESLADSSRSDLGPRTLDLGPRSGDLPSAESLARNEPEEVPAAAAQPNSEEQLPAPKPPAIEWPPDAIEFGRTFYALGKATPQRRADFATQINGVLNGGCAFRGGILRATPERLARRCREVLDSPPKDHNSAIVVLLTKLSDVGNATDSPTEQLARQDKQEFGDDQNTVDAWLEQHPDDAKAIRAKMRRLLPGSTQSVIEACIAGEVRKRLSGAPDLLPHSETTASGP
ncbi:MAG TPA: hypothetical protein VJO33_05045 [Gemmatimonadaceae bacterium]|nr:hypothetical protein [Gemmatimonadaceae bacterium]